MTDTTMFDLLDFEERPAYTGAAPLHFTAEYFTPHELVEAHKEAHRGREWGMPNPPHTWDLGITTGWCNRNTPGHNCWMLQVDTRCHCRFPYTVAQWDQIGPCYCVGYYLHQANCPDCRWHHIATSENQAVEAWHDHAWPGWRDLPVMPDWGHPTRHDGERWTKKALAWIDAEFPEEWKRPGAPIITERARMGTRHVAGRSPWGGFDMSAADRMRWFPPSGPVTK